VVEEVMRIVVTGAAGFIGSVLSLRASELGHDVLALDDLSRGKNVILDVPGIGFVKHDCRGGIAEAVQYTRRMPAVYKTFDTIDAVVHFAAGTGSLDRPLEELRMLNVEMTKHVYDDAIALGAKTFAFPTTSLALGVPDSPYVISKEEAFAWVRKQTAVPVLPLRFFNVAGAYKGYSEFRKNEVHLIPRLVECYKTREALVINGNDYETPDGTPSRDFVHVLDVVDTILALISAGVNTRLRQLLQPDGAFWIGTGRTTTVREAVAIFEQFIGRVDVKIGPRRAYDVGGLVCPATAINALRVIRPTTLAPSWVSIRDEAETLLGS
jgi:UDP-glucose 4-epimerase